MVLILVSLLHMHRSILIVSGGSMGSLFSGFLTVAAAASENAFQVSIPSRG